MDDDLRRISTERLAAELERRSACLWREPRPIPNCDECNHFTPYIPQTESDVPPASYNPCAKGRAMRFRLPESMGDVNSGNWGYYLRGCKDRATTKSKQPRYVNGGSSG